MRAKYLVALAFSLLTIVSSALCQINRNNNEIDTSTKVSRSSRQVFWDSLPRPVGYVNDFENLFSPEEEQSLDSLILAFENKTTIQIAVITFDTSMTTADSLEPLTRRMANIWGVGQKDKNNGVTIGISREYRRMRIENGYGIEKVLTDAETKQIIDTAFIPGYREGKYFEGTLNGLKALMTILEGRYR